MAQGGDGRTRKSKFPMLEVAEALLLVMRETGTTAVVRVETSKALGLHLAEAVEAVSNIPELPTSMMDGYAVRAPIQEGVYPVQAQVRAGDATGGNLEEGKVMYITTGAILPAGADAVVKIEDTSAPLGSSHDGTVTGHESLMNGEEEVLIQTSISNKMHNVRDVGSDIRTGEMVLKEGTVIGPVEIGLLATIGVTYVKCYKKPVVGVMSTGNELVEPNVPNEELPSGKIRDSNRIALLSSLIEDRYETMDLGIVGDSMDTLRTAFVDAMQHCDVIITSGGVSMGDADIVKPLLDTIGKVHFGRVNMKPGKPTTFATIDVTPERTVLFFGLPGNPVSCLVTKALFVEPALRRLEGQSSEACMPVQCPAVLTSDGSPPTSAPNPSQGGFKLDTERPEYHRGVLGFDAASGRATVRSTGTTVNARSSRLLSMQAADSLIMLPKAASKRENLLPYGSMVTVIVLGGHRIGMRPPPADACVFAAAARYDDQEDSAGTSDSGVISLSTLGRDSAADAGKNTNASEKESKGTAASGDGKEKRVMRVGLLTISDRASNGIYEDKSGPAMQDKLQSFCVGEKAWALGVEVVHAAIVPDEPPLIRSTVCSWCDSNAVDLVLTSGGTGFGARDVTPETISPLFDRAAPGVAQALLNEGLQHTPLAVLSRPVAGIRNSTFIATLPGSVKAVKENVMALKPLLPRIVELLQSGSCSPPPPPA